MADLTLIPNRVSLIVPCYDVEMWLEDFVDSVIKQTYKDLEVILVNDGANLATTQMLRAAVPELERQGYLVKLIEQENKGLGGACDTGLKHFTGEFLMWPDPDDWLLPNSVERRVALMRGNPEIGLLRTNAQLWIEAKATYAGHFMPVDEQPRLDTDLFNSLIVLQRFHAPVCSMVRSSMFLRVHPNRSIWFGPKSSQNFQMLVPFVERFPVLEVPSEVLAGYRVRKDSRSRAHGRSAEKLMARYDQLFELAWHTMPKLRTATPERLERMENFHWRNRMLPTAFRAAMEDRCKEIVGKSALDSNQKWWANILITVRCNSVFQALDVRSRRIASRALARVFDRLVMLPHDQRGWGIGPLWAV